MFSDYPYGNLHDCSFDPQSVEYAHVVNGQVGQYFILLITKFGSGSGNITFQKVAGNGETDCGILPGVATNDGPYCVGQTINLSVNAQDGASYSWTGPGGWTSTQRLPCRPNCTMAMAGTYTCVTTVGTQSVTATTQVVIYPQPTADFTATTVCQGNATQFTSTSTTNPTGQSISSYQWNFGDGGTSTQQNPTHTYTQPGTYTVTLTVNCGGICSDTKTQTVTVIAQPDCSFNATTVCCGNPTQFTSTATGQNISSYQWNFGDGQTGSGATTSHTYAQPGTYTVTHTVATGNGDCSDTETMTVTVLAQPICNFNYIATCAGSPVEFWSTSTGADITSYQWDFGDGQNGVGETVNHTYTQPGTYYVTHTVSIANNACNDEMTQAVTVLPLPTANFTFTTVCAGTPTEFTSTATGQDITIYHWNFGDGQTGSGQNVTHTFAQAGTYEVTHTVSSSDGICEDILTQTVTVNAMPSANAGPDQTISYGGTAQLSGSAGTGTFSFHWEPANMVVNANAQNTQTVVLTNTQTYTLTVTNPQSQECVDTDQVTIYISGSSMTVTPGPNVSICQGGSATILANAGGGTGNFNYSWTPTTGLSNPHIYNPVASPTQTTTYTCNVSDGQTSQSVSVTVTVNDVIIEHENASICPGESYLWDWDGNSYSSPGTYEYNTTTPEGCAETIYLHLDQYPEYNETIINAAICDGESYPFYGTNYSESIQTTYTDHTIHGCDSIITLNLTVYPPNDTLIIDPTICSYQSYNFHGTLYNQDGQIAYFDTIDYNGCLKVEKLILTVGEYQMPAIESEYVCVPHGQTPYFKWDKNNQEYFADAYDEIVLPDPNGGCDFKYRLDLKFHQEFYKEEEPVITCDQYQWPLTGEIFTETDHHIVRTFTHGFGDKVCDSTYILDVTINQQSILPDQYLSDSCDFVPVHCLGQDTVFTSNTTYTFVGYTDEGCYSEQTYHIENIHYTPAPEIRCADQNVEYPHFPITATEFNVNRYTYYAIDPSSDASWINDSCRWSISKPSWRIEPSDDNRSCTVYAMDWTADTIWLTFKAVNPCSSNEGILARFWFKPSFYGVEEQEAYPASVSIVPNPNDGQMQLRFENMEGRLSIKVYATGGSLIDSFEVNTLQMGETYDYSMKRLQNGVYYIVVSDGKRSVTKKAVIIR